MTIKPDNDADASANQKLPRRIKLRLQRTVMARFAGAVLAVIAVIWIFLEEWVWDSMLAAMTWLGKLPLIHWLETQLTKLPPYAALVAFLIPAAILLPFKLAAFWLIAHGHSLIGMQVFIVAKLVGTALLARIFALTKPALMTIDWFARAYNAFSAWKLRLVTYVKNLNAYARALAFKNALKARIRAFWKKT
jgi:hypothetical protein